jgi:hypothetical protein
LWRVLAWLKAAVLSDRHLAGDCSAVLTGLLLCLGCCRFLPDKAIDLIDEAAAKLKMEITSKPEALDEMDRKVLQLEMERLSLQKVSDGFDVRF